jgi:peroxiredoxin
MKVQTITLVVALMLTTGIGSKVLADEAAGAAPDCELTALTDNQAVNISSYRGKVLVMDFWASWCGPCAQAFPFYNELQQTLQGQGLQVVGVNLDTKPAEAQSFLAQHPANFPIMVDAAKRCPQAFGVKAMPSSYLIDRKGVIRHVHLGFRPGEARAEMRAWVDKLLAEQP